MKFDRKEFASKIEHIIRYEIRMGISKNKAEFARNYGISPQLLNKYFKFGSLGMDFVARVCTKYRITSDFLLFNKNTLPPNKLPDIPE